MPRKCAHKTNETRKKKEIYNIKIKMCVIRVIDVKEEI